ncbi:MAG: lysophospholipid acyltransferase family protein [Rhodospirillaceae bacterium]|nr:lysophospholipid acyltransferase family protein [Rhodospirillaceae bacterium]MBT3927323.1 lysophospholipid acyltransferase family protein [Rhodospirillaceae bacterium]MBT4427464.1 lysophospholipid acyltransferase family protein [Rhodospirillaceae bacterium]MBT5040534.1 lysophospholipid acyltransferase family protein [Rhodospirillaceae bacterium]MBT5676329.1 lysophospholipid acyltransferase family protein [Rhodospirillaceae bacterium]
MRPLKRLTRSSAFQSLLCWVAANYIRLVYVTGRWREEGREPALQLTSKGEPYIAAFWHGRLLMAPTGWDRRAPLSVMISQHRDGEMIARTVHHFGVTTVRGSTTRGGSKALRKMLKTIKSGHNVAITPDGPRGPRMRAQAGIVLLARLSGAPIVPATYAVSRRKLASSWDRFVIALPFSRGVYLWGAPIYVDRDADEEALERARLELEDSLNALTEEADRRVGVVPVTPAEASAA